MSAMAAPWEATARTIETIRETLYGRRKPSRRANVFGYGLSLCSFTPEIEPGALSSKTTDFLSDERGGPRRQLPVRGRIQPTARTGRVGERNCDRAVELVRAADAVREAASDAEDGPDRKAADGHDQLRVGQPQFPLTPEGAELLLARRRRPISATGRRAPGIATGYRGAVERPVEVGFVQLEPATKCLAGATAPRAALRSLDDAGRLPVHVRPLVEVLVHDRQGLERIAGFDTGPANTKVALQRGE